MCGLSFLLSFECEADNWPALNANDVEGVKGLTPAVSCSGDFAEIVDVHLCEILTLSSATPTPTIAVAIDFGDPIRQLLRVVMVAKALLDCLLLFGHSAPAGGYIEISITDVQITHSRRGAWRAAFLLLRS
jgi:hypothetical protein